MRVSKSTDAQAVRRVKLALEKLAASLLDFSQLQQAGSGQQRLHIPLLHGHLSATNTPAVSFSHIISANM